MFLVCGSITFFSYSLQKDAEGRMLICDLLNEAKDLALKEKNPHLFTIATLTGHCLNAYGKNYSVSINDDNYNLHFLD